MKKTRQVFHHAKTGCIMKACIMSSTVHSFSSTAMHQIMMYVTNHIIIYMSIKTRQVKVIKVDQSYLGCKLCHTHAGALGVEEIKGVLHVEEGILVAPYQKGWPAPCDIPLIHCFAQDTKINLGFGVGHVNNGNLHCVLYWWVAYVLVG